MNDKTMKAMILAAGEGPRLRPLTLETPKVLLPVGGRPLIEHTLAWLRSHSIREVAINLYHLGDKIKDFLGDGSHFGVKISYSEEEKLLGTAGGAKRMAHLLLPNPQSPIPNPQPLRSHLWRCPHQLQPYRHAPVPPGEERPGHPCPI